MTFGGQQQLQVRENTHTERGLGSYVVSIAQRTRQTRTGYIAHQIVTILCPPPRLLITSTCTHAG
ncbi:hypothetical protein Peur_030416 [Populus x canadensis]